MGWIKRAWRGQERLWKVFWIYGLLLGIVMGVLSVVVAKVWGPAAVFPFQCISFIISIWSMVSLWRCAFNANWKIWSYVVRILVILNILFFIVGFVMGFTKGFSDGFNASYHQKLEERYKISCEQIMTDYAIKNGSDPVQYIAQNQDYLKKCEAYYQQNKKASLEEK